MIPVRFQLDGASAGIKMLAAYVSITKISNSIEGIKHESNGCDHPDSGDRFRFEAGEREYELNLPTRNLTQGTYLIKADLTDGNGQRVSDGVVHSIHVSLRR